MNQGERRKPYYTKKGVKNMSALEKRKKLIEQFNNKKNKSNLTSKNIVSFKELDIKFEKESFQWYRQMNGGGRHE
jgi:hypothetical protein